MMACSQVQYLRQLEALVLESSPVKLRNGADANAGIIYTLYTNSLKERNHKNRKKVGY